MSPANARSDDDFSDDDLGTLDDLAGPEEVEPARERGQLTRLLVSLVVAGVVLGGIIAGVTGFLTGFVQTEAGLCRHLPAPCTSLSLESVSSFAEVSLPEGSEVVSSYLQESSAGQEFRAEVMLPAGATTRPLTPGYVQLEGDWSDSVPAVVDSQLENVSYWWREIGGANSAAAAQGTNSQGRIVLFFDTRLTRQ